MKAVNESVNKADYSYPYIGIGTDFENNPLHFHTELEILYVLSGAIDATVDGEHRALKTGDICVILPGQVHTLLQIGQIQLLVIKILPATPMFGTHLDAFVYSEDSPHHSALRSSLEIIRKEDEERSLGYALAVQNACGALTLYILRTLASQTVTSKSQMRSFDLYFFKKACAFIEESYENDISLDRVSSYFGYSRAYFSRLFKAVCGMNFFDYLSLFRLKKSITLLRETDRSIESIAFCCGYNCLRSYNRAFLRYFGQSPGSYRRRFLQSSQDTGI